MNQLIQQVQPAYEQDDERIDLVQYFGFIADNRRLIAVIAFVITMIGLAYAVIATPIYETNILLQIDSTTGANPNPQRSVLGDISNPFDLKTEVNSEMEILRSRQVVSHVVDSAKLYIEAQPKYFPVIGSWIARSNKKNLSNPGLFGYGGYAWGGEKIGIIRFDVPEELEGRTFILTMGNNGDYSLHQEDHNIDISGRVGSNIQARTAVGNIDLHVDALNARPGAQFVIVRKPYLDAVEKLQRTLTVSEKGKQSGIINVSLDGPDPHLAKRILNDIGQEYIRLNVKKKSQEAERSLSFINKQLPDLKLELERAEAKYNDLRNRYGILDLAEESKLMLQRSSMSRTRLSELRQKREELLARYQNEHPLVQAVNQQIRGVNQELNVIEAKLKILPGVEQDMVRLSRDVKVNTEMYTALLGAAQQLRLASASKSGSAHLLDVAPAPIRPIKPKRLMIVGAALLIGIVLGVLVAYARKALLGRVDNPREVERLLGVHIAATIPHSRFQKQLSKSKRSESNLLSLPDAAPTDDAVEGLRAFRTSMQFSMLNARNNIVMITGPTPGVGKSFVSANFAMILAAIGKKILLIDCDLRTGQLHHQFGLSRERGLSNVISAEIPFDEAVHRTVAENLDFIATGNLPKRPAELLAEKSFGSVLQMASTRYDFIVIDTAPVLAVSDALVIGAHAGTIFNVVRGGHSTVSEIEETVKRLNRAGHTVTGNIFNDVKSRTNVYGYEANYGSYA